MSYAVMPLQDYKNVCDKIRSIACNNLLTDTTYMEIGPSKYVFFNEMHLTKDEEYILKLPAESSTKSLVGHILFAEHSGPDAPTHSMTNVPFTFTATESGLYRLEFTCNFNEELPKVDGATLVSTKHNSIKSSELVDKLDAVKDAGIDEGNKQFWDNIFQNGERTHFIYGFAGDSLIYKLHTCPYTIKPVDPKSGSARSAERMFAYVNRAAGKQNDVNSLYDMTEVCKKLDLSEVRNASSMLSGSYLRNITIDLSNAERIDGILNCGDSGRFENVILTVSEKCTNYTNAFSYCTQLENLYFTDNSIIAANISFANCSSLTIDSLKSIINALEDRTGKDSLTITFHSTITNNLMDEQRSQILAKNWNIG